ncbi:MAG: hypothetical protein WCL19_10060 [Verrucomicrobiota bacterium]
MSYLSYSRSMQNYFSIISLGVILAAGASAQSLYQATNSADEPLPLRWVAGANVIYDDNVATTEADKQSSIAYNPSVGLSFTRTTPQTVIDVNGRLGVIYYPDAPVINGQPIDDLSNQSRLGVSLTHRFSERLRFTSQNMISREREPEYSYGIASGRRTNSGEYISSTSDNTFGYRWTERFGTTTGIKYSQIDNPNADSQDSNRTTWEFHHQFRYQYSPQNVVTSGYRYEQGEASGDSQNSTDHFLTVGDEYRFSPNTIGVISAGAQMHSIDGGDSSTVPFLELSGNSRVNQQLSFKTFIRYRAESDGLTRSIDGKTINYSKRETLRLGVTNEYQISPKFILSGGLDYIPGSYTGASQKSLDREESLLNMYISATIKFNDFLTGVATYTFADNVSDFVDENYRRNRISLGLNASF